MRGFGNGVELIQIHRVGTLRTGRYIGDLTLVTGCADRHGIGARGDRVGAQRNRIGATCGAEIPQRRAQFTTGQGLRAHGGCAFARRIREVAHRGGFGAGGFAQRADRGGVGTRRNRAGAKCSGGFATGLGLHEEAQTRNQIHRTADGSAAGAAGAGLRANRSGVIARRIGDRTESRGLRTGRIRTHAERRCRKAIGLGACADCGSADAGAGSAGGDRHAAIGDQRLAIFIHCSAAHGHAGRAIGLRVMAEGCAVLPGRQRIGADRSSVLGHRIGAGSQRCGRRADGIGALACSQCAIAFDVGAYALFARARLEELRGVFSNIGHVAQLRHVDRIGGIDAGSDIGDAARGRATAAVATTDGHHVVFVGARVCAAHAGIGTRCHAVFAALAHEAVVADG